MIKAVIFDMDGVLIDAKEWHYEALNRALRFFGFEIDRTSYERDYNGLPTSKKLRLLSTRSGLPQELHPVISEMKQTYTMEMVHDMCKPLLPHQEALSELKKRGYNLAVASNSVRDTVNTMMKKAQLDCYLDFMLSNQDVSAPKPAPEIYLKAIAQLGLLAHECLVVEDNDYGIQAANAAGAHVLVVRDVGEVNIANILGRIKKIDEESA